MFDNPEAAYTGNTNTNRLNTGKSAQLLALEKDVAANPADKAKLLKLAHTLGDNGYYMEAIRNYEEYLVSDPSNADVIVDMGVAHFNMKNFPKAIEVMESALKYKPDHLIANFNLGIVNFNAGNMDKAKEWWNKVINIAPGSDFAKRAKDFINSH